MSIEYLKKGKSQSDVASDDKKVEKIVSSTLELIDSQGDRAVKRLVRKV